MSKFSKLLSMIELLKNNGRMNRKEIAEKLGVSERMVRKYVDDLLEANVNIESFTGPKGGYEINNNSLGEEDVKAYEETINQLKAENTMLLNKLNNIKKILN